MHAYVYCAILFNGSNLLEVDRHVTIYEEVLLFAATVNIFMA